MTTTTTTPKPTSVKTPDTDTSPFSDKRTYSYHWEGNFVADRYREGDGDGDNTVTLTISHDKHRKEYDVRISAVQTTDFGYRECFDMRSKVPTYILRQRTARYSRKVLDELAAEALAEFPGNIPAGGPAAEVWGYIEEFGTSADPK